MAGTPRAIEAHRPGEKALGPNRCGVRPLAPSARCGGTTIEDADAEPNVSGRNVSARQRAGRNLVPGPWNVGR